MHARVLLALIAHAFLFVLIGAGAAPRHAQAQPAPPPYRPHARVVLVQPHGLYLGGGPVMTRILHQEGGAELLDHGGGLALHAGWRSNHLLAFEAGWIGTLHNPERVRTALGEDIDYLVHSGLTGDVLIMLTESPASRLEARPGGGRWEPFVQAGVGLYLLHSAHAGVQSAGTGFQVGGGARYRAGRHLTIGLRAVYRGISLGPPERTYSDTYVSAATAQAALSVRF